MISYGYPACLELKLNRKEYKKLFFILIFLADFINIYNSLLSLRTVKNTNSFELPIFTPKTIEIEGRKLSNQQIYIKIKSEICLKVIT